MVACSESDGRRAIPSCRSSRSVASLGHGADSSQRGNRPAVSTLRLSWPLVPRGDRADSAATPGTSSPSAPRPPRCSMAAWAATRFLANAPGSDGVRLTSRVSAATRGPRERRLRRRRPLQRDLARFRPPALSDGSGSDGAGQTTRVPAATQGRAGASAAADVRLTTRVSAATRGAAGASGSAGDRLTTRVSRQRVALRERPAPTKPA